MSPPGPPPPSGASQSRWIFPNSPSAVKSVGGSNSGGGGGPSGVAQTVSDPHDSPATLTAVT